MGQPAGRLSRERLAAMSGFSEAEIDQCEEAGAIARTDGNYRTVELIKLQLIRQVAESSGGLETVLKPYREGRFTLSFLDQSLPHQLEFSDKTGREVLADAGISQEEVEAILRAAGLTQPNLDQPLRSDDVEVFGHFARLRQLPIPSDARIHATRAIADALHRAAAVPVKLFQEKVEGPLLEAYRDDVPQGQKLIADVAGAALDHTIAMAHWMYRRFLEHEILKDVTTAMEVAARGERPQVQRRRDPTIAFVDLVGFTALSASEGDEEAAHLLQHFYDHLVDIARTHDGQVVKLLGDGAMLVFEDGAGAVRTGLQVLQALPEEGLPPARFGINRGPVVAQAGDYYGATVNTAARINDYARPNEVLLSASVVPDGADGIDLEEIGEVTLKGVPHPVRIYRARAAG